jgi:2-polyprenyl-3-methyl-5-hydroxy-6-metoxy-1,4-benzoquinol methylase
MRGKSETGAQVTDDESQSERAALLRSWTTNAGAWTTAVRDRVIPSRRAATDAAIVSACARLMQDRTDVRALDVGCGEGWLARVLARLGAHVTGVDASAPLIDTARAAGGDVDYACLSYEQLASDASVLAGPFDLVVCNFALLDDRVATLLAALTKRLPSSGVILVQTVHPWAAVGDGPYEDGWRTETWRAFGTAFPAPMPWYFRTTGSWIGAAREAGLLVEHLEEMLHPETHKPLSLLLELC